jgi:exopolyphosphatase / guanosine-5'-triphosphate,3'-diphosphate pyrophosphatase
MKIAALDLGTNSFLCLIAEKTQSGGIRILHDAMKIVRLGQGLGESGRIHPEALIRADHCLAEFAELIRKFKVEHVQAVATAAAREAENAADFLKICEKNEIPLITITGEEEASLSFQGAIDKNENIKVLLIDIGGGSTEYIVGQGNQINLAQSLPYGAVKLTEKWILKQPVPNDQEENLRNYIKNQTEALWAQIQNLSPEKIWAVAGTPTALATAILDEPFNEKKIEGRVINQTLLKNWIYKLKNSTVAEKKQKFGFGERSDIIFAGTIILDELLKRMNKNEFFVSTKGIRHGLAYKMASTLS